MAKPIGVQNNNPLNIRPLPGGREWDGQTGQVATAVGPFCVFKTPVYGFRAAAKNIIAYIAAGCVTPQQIINRWAPPADHNDTSAYVLNVCAWSGLDKDRPLTLVDMPATGQGAVPAKVPVYDDIFSLLYAMTKQEQGASLETYFQKWQLNDGLRLAGVGDVPQGPRSGIHKVIGAAGATVAIVAQSAPEIQAGISSVAPTISAIPSPTVQLIYKIVTVLGVLLGIYAAIQMKRRIQS